MTNCHFCKAGYPISKVQLIEVEDEDGNKYSLQTSNPTLIELWNKNQHLPNFKIVIKKDIEL